MSEYFTALDGRRPDEGFQLLDEVFHLEDQLDRLASGADTTHAGVRG
jgi:L-rhamnose mutarotase